MAVKNDLTAPPPKHGDEPEPELNIDKGPPEKDKPAPIPAAQLALGLLFGVIFGFLLQKGGVAKHHVLMGVLLLDDYTVIKVMLSAIVVGMLGVFGLLALGKVKLHVKQTRYAANVIGGIIFGVGFGLSGYCPGTGAAAVGQGNFDALGLVAGLMAGSYAFAEMSGFLGKTLQKWGDRGKLMLPELLRISPAACVAGAASIIVVVLLVLDRVTPR